MIMGVIFPKPPKGPGDAKSRVRRVFEVLHRLNGAVVIVWTPVEVLNGLTLHGGHIKFAYAVSEERDCV